MRRIAAGPLFISALALVVLLYGSLSAGAHEAEGHIEGYNVKEHDYETPAGEVDPADRQSVYDFLLHLRVHMEDSRDIGTLVALKEKAETEGYWRNDANHMYLIRLDLQDKVVHHTSQRVLEGGNLSAKSSTVRELVKLAEEKPGGGCVQYEVDGTDRWACAAEFKALDGSDTFWVWVVGYHHSFEEVSFADSTCPFYVPETNAIDVENAKDPETLKKFVDEFASFWAKQEAKGIAAALAQKNCHRVLPWKYGSIYLYRRVHPENRALFNANSPEFENQLLYVTDENGCNSADEINRVLRGEKRQCKSLGYLSEDDKKGNFIEYLWDDPLNPDDDVDINTECPDGPRTCAPGTSPKVGYFVAVEEDSGEEIIGSGYYPETREDRGDGDGCAVAGAGHKAQGSLLNLFLIVSVLLSAATAGNRFRRSRTAGRKGGAGRRVSASLFAVALLFLLSWGDSAAAHEGDGHTTVAGDVEKTDKEDMKNFLLHAKAHWEAVGTPSENLEFERSLNTEGSDWNSGTVYLMAITEKGSILVCGDYPDVSNGTLIHYGTNEAGEREGFFHEEVAELIAGAKGSEEGGCVTYGHEEDGHGMRAACAVKFKHPVWNADGESSLILLAGYHHDHVEDDDIDISFNSIECPYFGEIRNESPFFFQGVTANEVADNETLKAFVDQFAAHFEQQANLPGRSYAELAVTRSCWRILPWKYEPNGTYIFMMTEDKLVFFNGLDPALENDTFNPTDENGCVIGDEVVNVALEGPGARQCKDLGLLPDDSAGFIEYLWDDPLNPDDDVDVFTECPNGPRTCSPGTTPKVSYLKPVTFLGQTFIIGSGYHPRGATGDGGGCAIAGSGSGLMGAAFGLLLVASVLFSAVLWRKSQTG